MSKVEVQSYEVGEVFIISPTPEKEAEMEDFIISTKPIEKIISKGEEACISRKVMTPSSASDCTIHRVPHNWRKLHETAFTPNFISIGPFHHGSNQRRRYYMDDNRYQAMEKLKLRFLSDLLLAGSMTTIERMIFITESPGTSSTSIVGYNDPDIQHLAFELNKLELEIRSRYSQTFNDIDSDEFVSIFIRDGCFLIQLLRLFANSHKVADDPIFSTRWLVPNLRRDVLLFENQLPWIVLEKIFEISGLDKEGHSLIDLALKFCNPLLPKQKNFLDEYIKSNPKPDHLLGLFHASFLSHFETHQEDNKSTSFCASLLSHFKKQESTAGHKVDEEQPQLELELISESERQQRFEEEPQFVHCVAELQDAGVKFKKRENHNLLDIAFKNGVLEIPPLLIDDNTGLVFLNFLACEQCNASLKPYFTHYVFFIDNLVNSAKDVEILHYKGIINHSLGSDEEVAELFNKLCKEIVHEVDNTNYLYEDVKAINKHCGTHWNRWKAELKYIYFRSPWTIFSIVFAIFLLILTTLQTIFTIIPFYQ